MPGDPPSYFSYSETSSFELLRILLRQRLFQRSLTLVRLRCLRREPLPGPPYRKVTTFFFIIPPPPLPLLGLLRTEIERPLLGSERDNYK